MANTAKSQYMGLKRHLMKREVEPQPLLAAVSVDEVCAEEKRHEDAEPRDLRGEMER
jgi:hypothetical protein